MSENWPFQVGVATWPFNAEPAWAFTTFENWPFAEGVWPFAAAVDYIEDSLVDNSQVDEDFSGGAGSFSVNGYTYNGDDGSFGSVSWGNKVAANLSPDTAVIQLSATVESITDAPALELYAMADEADGAPTDAFYVRVLGTALQIYSRIGGVNNQESAVVLGAAPIATDQFAIRVAKNGTNWDVSAWKNGVEEDSITNFDHTGSLGQFSTAKILASAGQVLTIQSALGEVLAP